MRTTFGGMIDITDRVPAEVPAHWLVYFTVEDAEATVAKANGRRRRGMFGPTEIARSARFAVLKDPYGAVFAVIRPDPQAEPSG